MAAKRVNDQSTPSWLLDVLECPVCFEPITKTPIFVCANREQHSICIDCYQPIFNANRPCPICRKKLTNIRSLRLEKIVEEMPENICKNNGCNFKKVHHTRKQVQDHEDFCSWRQVQCGKCEDFGSLNALPDHLSKQHDRRPREMAMSKASNYKTNLDTIRKDQCVIELVPYQFHGVYPGDKALNPKGRVPFLSNWLEVDNAYFICWLSYCGPKRHAANYKYTLKIKNSKEEKAGKTTYLYEGTTNCVPCDISQEEIKETKQGLVISKKIILAASDAHQLAFSYQIDPVKTTRTLRSPERWPLGSRLAIRTRPFFSPA